MSEETASSISRSKLNRLKLPEQIKLSNYIQSVSKDGKCLVSDIEIAENFNSFKVTPNNVRACRKAIGLKPCAESPRKKRAKKKIITSGAFNKLMMDKIKELEKRIGHLESELGL